MREPAKLVLASMDGPVSFHPTEHRPRIEPIPVRDMYSSADLLRSDVPGPFLVVQHHGDACADREPKELAFVGD